MRTYTNFPYRLTPICPHDQYIKDKVAPTWVCFLEHEDRGRREHDGREHSGDNSGVTPQKPLKLKTRSRSLLLKNRSNWKQGQGHYSSKTAQTENKVKVITHQKPLKLKTRSRSLLIKNRSNWKQGQGHYSSKTAQTENKVKVITHQKALKLKTMSRSLLIKNRSYWQGQRPFITALKTRT